MQREWPWWPWVLPVLCGHLEARSLAFLQASMAEESRLCNLQVCLQAVEACVDRRDADAWHPHDTPHWSAVDDSVEYSIPHHGSFHRWYASAPASALPLYLPLALPLALASAPASDLALPPALALPLALPPALALPLARVYEQCIKRARGTETCARGNSRRFGSDSHTCLLFLKQGGALRKSTHGTLQHCNPLSRVATLQRGPLSIYTAVCCCGDYDVIRHPLCRG